MRYVVLRKYVNMFKTFHSQCVESGDSRHETSNHDTVFKPVNENTKQTIFFLKLLKMNITFHC